MPVWAVVLAVGIAGLLGGLINALLANEGLVQWRTEVLPDGSRIWRPGFVGNMIIGAVTALVLAGLYSPLGSVSLGGASSPPVTLTIGALAGALLSGIGGARLLTNEVDKRSEAVTRAKLGSAIEHLSRAAAPPAGKGQE
jgi:hypothetical protein